MKKYLTIEGQKKILDELAYLTQIKRIELSEQLKFATSLGDLRENSEYDAVCEDFEKTENRIYELERKLNEAKIYQKKNDGKIEIGSIVKLEIENEIETYEIVGLDESNILENKISYETPLAKSILGKKKNDITKIDNYDNSYIVKILEITQNLFFFIKRM